MDGCVHAVFARFCQVDFCCELCGPFPDMAPAGLTGEAVRTCGYACAYVWADGRARACAGVRAGACVRVRVRAGARGGACVQVRAGTCACVRVRARAGACVRVRVRVRVRVCAGACVRRCM